MQQEIIIPIKSPNDDRDYEACLLSNQLRVLLIHDSKAEKAACSISVGVGSLKDGSRSLGLAHFLQHMLFMGSEKYPRHNEYSEFMSLNSGMDNAYTSDEETNYYFEIATNKFAEGVERISDFFVKALLTDSCIQKERQAVHEECQLRCGEDNSRKWEILKKFASGSYHNHSIGNNKTLGHPDVAEDLKNFYQKQYSANRINAVLLSSTPIKEMKQTLLPFFQRITNKQLPAIQYQPHFLPQNLNQLVKMQSIKDESIMEFFWMIDSVRPAYLSHPQKYISHVLGHQGKNSLLSILKKKQFACSISSYSHDMPQCTIIGLQLQLTETGKQKYEQVYNLVISYAKWLKSQQHIYKQISEASGLSFRFKEKGGNSEYVCELSGTMHLIKNMKELLNFKAIYEPFDAEKINHFIRQLVPENLIVVYSNAEELEQPQNQEYLGGKYTNVKLPEPMTNNYNFQSLVVNPFLPLDMGLKQSRAEVSKVDNIYYSLQNMGVCKGGIKLRVHSKKPQIFLQFYSSYLELLLKQLTYEAQSLKLDIDYNYQDQLQISIYGFSHTVQRLIEQLTPIISKIHKGQQSENTFNLCLDNLLQEYQNFFQGDVDETVSHQLQTILRSTGQSIKESMQILQGYEYDAITEQIDAFWKDASLDWIVVGNFDLKETRQLLKTFQDKVNCSHKNGQDQINCFSVQNDIINVTHLTSTEIGTSGCIVYHQVGPYSQQLFYTLSLLKNYIKEPFFDQLRTQKQLAYYLTAYSQNTRGILSLLFLLISSNADPHAVSEHIHSFVKEFISAIETDLTEQKFEMLKNSIRTKMYEPHSSLKEFYRFVAREIDEKTFNFNRKTKEDLQQYLTKIKKEDVIQLLKKCTQKSLQVWVVAQPHEQQFKNKKVAFIELQQIKKKAKYHQNNAV